MDSIVQGVAKSRARLSDFHSHFPPSWELPKALGFFGLDETVASARRLHRQSSLMEGPRSPRSVPVCFSSARCELTSRHWYYCAFSGSSHTRSFRHSSFLLETSVLPSGVTVLHFRDCPGVVLVGTTSPGFISGDFRHRCSLNRGSGQRSLPSALQRGRPAVCQLPASSCSRARSCPEALLPGGSRPRAPASHTLCPFTRGAQPGAPTPGPLSLWAGGPRGFLEEDAHGSPCAVSRL